MHWFSEKGEKKIQSSSLSILSLSVCLSVCLSTLPLFLISFWPQIFSSESEIRKPTRQLSATKFWNKRQACTGSRSNSVFLCPQEQTKNMFLFPFSWRPWNQKQTSVFLGAENKRTYFFDRNKLGNTGKKKEKSCYIHRGNQASERIRLNEHR